MQTTNVPLDQIRLDGGTQPRVKIDQDAVAEHKVGYEHGEERPPLDVFFDGVVYWLADGFHRWHGASQAKLEEHPCVIHQGAQRDAVLFSVGANGKHGLRRTNDDKRKAVSTLLADSEWGARSQNWIAEKCGVSSGFVSDVVAQLPLNGSSIRPEKTKGKDGKLRPARKPKEPEPQADAEVAPEETKKSQFNPEEFDPDMKPGKKPKNGAVVLPAYDEKQMDQPISKLRKELDRRLEAYPATEREFRATKHAMGEFVNRLIDWRKAQ